MTAGPMTAVERDTLFIIRDALEWATSPESGCNDLVGMCLRALNEVDRALSAQPAPTQGSGDVLRARALKIIADEDRFAATDDKNNIELYALRLARAGTAKQILGDLPMEEPVLAGAIAASAPQSGGYAGKSWRCFWCNKLFTNQREALEHFGRPHGSQEWPDCVLKQMRADAPAPPASHSSHDSGQALSSHKGTEP